MLGLILRNDTFYMKQKTTYHLRERRARSPPYSTRPRRRERKDRFPLSRTGGKRIERFRGKEIININIIVI